jgi:hypothetical protein
MRKNLYSLITGFLVALVHAIYTIHDNEVIASRWAYSGERDWLYLYFLNGDYFLGLAYGMAVGFFIYILLTFLSQRNAGFYGIVGGASISGILYGAGCFLVGCCGSPMLGVYVAVFGVSFLGFTKPIIFIVTLASIIFGVFQLNRKNRKETACCSIGGQCRTGENNVR